MMPEQARPAIPSNSPGLWALLLVPLRGPRRRVAALALLKSWVWFVLGVVCALRAIEAVEIRSVVLWSLGTIVCVVGVAIIKIWWWLEINHESTLGDHSAFGVGTR